MFQSTKRHVAFAIEPFEQDFWHIITCCAQAIGKTISGHLLIIICSAIFICNVRKLCACCQIH